MAAGAVMALPPEARGGLRDVERLAPGDQRAMGRAYFARRAGFSPGGASIQGDEAEWLKYIADVGRGVPPKPRKSGFAGVQRR